MRRKLGKFAVLLAPVVIALVAAWVLWPASEPDVDLLDLASSGPTFGSLEELAEASDLVVVGVVEQTRSGRTISDPVDPAAGITTALFEISVDTTILGDQVGALVVEHEVALADGTPISIDGVGPPEVGERLLMFLVAGDSEAFPHHAVVSNQGRFFVDGSTLTPVTNDVLSEAIAAMGLTEVEAELGKL